MTLAQRFAAAVAAEVAAAADDDGHLLPDQLARATVRVLAVDGAGLSVLTGTHGRCPLGASSPEAARAERLQFTVGTGPCLLAHASGQPVFAAEDDLHRRWPTFADLLVATTPYRGVVSLPVPGALAGAGALDLFLVDPDDVVRLDVFDALGIGHLVSGALSDAVVWSPRAEGDGPGWLHSPAAVRRAAVWRAVGALSVSLDADADAALAVLRAHAWVTGRSVDSVAADLVSGRLVTADVLGRPGGP
ncbi:GAF domain-containing protein [Modestobacter sp. VKM Ac-2985]|uniref:GAF domain-containing protein n=1 Tax=Modestobacter sp. VKM Ac-2985 TaxID=3004139 RepID=UPI0022AB6F82|nr:GAF domain-containing protein [Modestobacter sp. VKM Ac-2985]MCZ2839815.1 GAF domain-containing protein [Modestobacter sp. VKM Ac-2985]